MGLTHAAGVLGLSIFARLAAGSIPATAQDGSLLGRVTDSRGSPLGGVEVTIGAGPLVARTSDSGTFRLEVPEGTHRITLRRVGFAPVIDSVTVGANRVLDRAFVLRHQVVALDPVVVERPLSIAMRAYEERRHSQQGAFIDWSDLSRDATKPLRSVLARRLPGVLFVSYHGALYAASVRGNTQMDRRSQIRSVIADPRSPAACFLQIFLDGTRLYAPDGSTDAINLNDFQTKDFEAVEYYSGSANTPPEFSSSWATCGTLVFWTRLP